MVVGFCIEWYVVEFFVFLCCFFLGLMLSWNNLIDKLNNRFYIGGIEYNNFCLIWILIVVLYYLDIILRWWFLIFVLFYVVGKLLFCFKFYWGILVKFFLNFDLKILLKWFRGILF